VLVLREYNRSRLAGERVCAGPAELRLDVFRRPPQALVRTAPRFARQACLSLRAAGSTGSPRRRRRRQRFGDQFRQTLHGDLTIARQRPLILHQHAQRSVTQTERHFQPAGQLGFKPGSQQALSAKSQFRARRSLVAVLPARSTGPTGTPLRSPEQRLDNVVHVHNAVYRTEAHQKKISTEHPFYW